MALSIMAEMYRAIFSHAFSWQNLSRSIQFQWCQLCSCQMQYLNSCLNHDLPQKSRQAITEYIRQQASIQ